MRTTQRDAKILQFGGYFVASGASGNGIAQPGSIPYVWKKIGTGNWELTFGIPIRIISTTFSASGGNVFLVSNAGDPTIGGQSINVWAVSSTTGAQIDTNFSFQVTAIDKRL